jgi:type I restriction enzyme S subunit
VSGNEVIPSGWSIAPICDLISRDGIFCDGDWVESEDQDPTGDVRLIQLADIGDGVYRNRSNRFLTSSKAAELHCTFLEQGDVLIARMPDPLGRACIFPGDGKRSVTAVDVCIIRTGVEGIDHHWLMHFVNSLHFRRSISELQSGTTRKRISRGNLATLSLPIPPTGEQRRIVAKIEELFSDLDAGVAALERVRANLKRYRTAVLKAAVEGKLTDDWRAQHPDTEPASVLLERILTARRRQWEQVQLTKFSQTNTQPPKGWREKYREPLSPETSKLPLLPSTWYWSSLEQVAEIEGGITKDQKRRLTATMRDVAYLRVANVQRGYLDLREIKSIQAEMDDIETLRLRKGDILFTEGGDRDKLGRGWVWNDEIEVCIHQNHVFRARLLTSDIEPKFVSYHGNYFGQQWFTRTGKQTTNLASINKGVLSRFPVPIPPPAEGAQIVLEVDRCLSIVDEIESQVEANLKRAARLRQGILKRAFEGRLVPQDATDEPAEKLMERIRRQRSTASPTGKGSPRTRRSGRPRKGERTLPLFIQDDGDDQESVS